MLYFEKGDIVAGRYPVFCQQVNCKQVMGAGLAKQIRNAYPEVYREYKHEPAKLGNILPVFTTDGRICINMYAQDGFGKDRRYTDYVAFKTCLGKIIRLVAEHHILPEVPIAFPYAIGCGLAGGDWNLIQGMLEDFSKEIPNKVVIVSLR